jgi:tetratricopeptide (TPR) repeat protein
MSAPSSASPPPSQCALPPPARVRAAWFDRGNIEQRLGDFEAALADYSRAADLAPGLAGYRLRQATLLFQVGRAEKACRMMQGVVRKNPQYGEIGVVGSLPAGSCLFTFMTQYQVYVADDTDHEKLGYTLACS